MVKSLQIACKTAKNIGVKALIATMSCVWLSVPAFAQDSDSPPPPSPIPEFELEFDLPQDDGVEKPDLKPRDLKRLELKDLKADSPKTDDLAETLAKRNQTDYAHLPESAERTARLDALFERLQAEGDPEAATLIAEEIWVIWLDSGSDSVNLLLRRGVAAQRVGDLALARRMYNHVTELSPEFSEGWGRSARLAMDEQDFSRAMNEATRALILEPRHFYSHLTLGGVFEYIGRTEAAYAAYKEANRLYPELKSVKDRLDRMKGSAEGDVL